MSKFVIDFDSILNTFKTKITSTLELIFQKNFFTKNPEIQAIFKLFSQYIIHYQNYPKSTIPTISCSYSY